MSGFVSPGVVVVRNAIATNKIISIPPNNSENSWAIEGWVSHSKLGFRIYASHCGAVFSNNTRQICAPEDLHLDVVPICTERQFELFNRLVGGTAALPIKEAEY